VFTGGVIEVDLRLTTLKQRMKCRLFSILAAASLLIALVAAVLWRRGHVVADWITYQRAISETAPYAHGRWSVLSSRGYLTFGLESVRGAASTDSENEQWLRNRHEVWTGWHIPHERSDAPWVYTDDGVVDEGIGSRPAVIVVRHSMPVRFEMIVAASLVLPGVWTFRRIREATASVASPSAVQGEAKG